MDTFFEFVANHPVLASTFVLLLVLFIRNETRRGGQSVSAQQLVDLVNRDNAVVLDVRDRKDFQAGHIANSINVPFATLESRLDELKKYQDRPIVVACRLGQHAGSVGTTLRKRGFTNVSRLTGGITEWRNQNLPVVKGKG